MTTFMIPFRAGGKTRLGDPRLALAMLSDVIDAVGALGTEAVLADGPGGQGNALARALAVLRGLRPTSAQRASTCLASVTMSTRGTTSSVCATGSGRTRVST